MNVWGAIPVKPPRATSFNIIRGADRYGAFEGYTRLWPSITSETSCKTGRTSKQRESVGGYNLDQVWMVGRHFIE